MSKPQEYIIHTEKEICGIRKACIAAGLVREKLSQLIVAGMTTEELNDLARDLIAKTGGKSAFLGYRGYPGEICISLNDVVVHGIGTKFRTITNGDIVSIDVGVNLDGFIGDNATTVAVGDIPENVQMLMKKTEESLYVGIDMAVKGNRIRQISTAIERVAKKARLGVVKDFVGHGTGVELHEPPEIPNFRNNNKGPILRPGMVLAIEPMFNLGTEKVFVDSDNWTCRTKDGQASAHYEHTILITKNKPEILTWQKK